MKSLKLKIFLIAFIVSIVSSSNVGFSSSQDILTSNAFIKEVLSKKENLGFWYIGDFYKKYFVISPRTSYNGFFDVNIANLIGQIIWLKYGTPHNAEIELVNGKSKLDYDVGIFKSKKNVETWSASSLILKIYFRNFHSDKGMGFTGYYATSDKCNSEPDKIEIKFKNPEKWMSENDLRKIILDELIDKLPTGTDKIYLCDK